MKVIALVLLALSAASSFAQSTVSAILNVYSYTLPGSPNYGIARGSIFAISGSGFTNTTSARQNVPLPNQLVGVVVQIGTDDWEDIVPLYYVSPTWIVGIMPSWVPAGRATLEVSGNGRRTGSVELKILQSAFGIATVNGSGAGAAIAQDKLSKYLDSSNSTKSGDVIQVFGTGVGPTTGNESVEQVPFDMTSIPMTAEIGGVPARILYRGRTIYPGLDRIEMEIPDLNANSFGCNVSLVIKSGGISSNTATIPVTPNGGNCASTSSTMTQEEIDRWSAAGTYTAGSLSLTQYTYNGARSEYIFGSFRRLSGADVARSLRNDAGVAAPSAGKCTVGAGSNSYPNIEYFTDLDAGPAVTSTGPNGSQVVPRALDHYGTWGYEWWFPSGNSYLTAGRYTVSGPGGVDVSSFSGALDVPAELVWTNQEEAQVVTRADGLTVHWTGGDSTQLIYISGTSDSLNAAASFTCYANNSAGHFTVPASILTQIPASDGHSYLYVSSTSAGIRLQASGVDYFIASSSSSGYVSSKYK